MSRNEREFLTGFAKAASLIRELVRNEPRITSREDYLEHVARLHELSEDLVGRGLALGCLTALGRG